MMKKRKPLAKTLAEFEELIAGHIRIGKLMIEGDVLRTPMCAMIVRDSMTPVLAEPDPRTRQTFGALLVAARKLRPEAIIFMADGWYKTLLAPNTGDTAVDEVLAMHEARMWRGKIHEAPDRKEALNLVAASRPLNYKASVMVPYDREGGKIIWHKPEWSSDIGGSIVTLVDPKVWE